MKDKEYCQHRGSNMYLFEECLTGDMMGAAFDTKEALEQFIHDYNQTFVNLGLGEMVQNEDYIIRAFPLNPTCEDWLNEKE